MDSPQTLLDQIHASGIYALDAGDSSTTEDRAQQARMLRPQLQAIRDQARRAQAALRASKNEATSGQLTPYAYLEEMLDKLEIALRAFVTDPTVRLPHYGTIFFGDPKLDDWHLGTPQQAQAWKLERQQHALAEQIVRTEAALEETRKRLKITRQELLAQGSAAGRVLRVIVGSLLIAAGILAASNLHSPLWLIISAAGLLLGGVGAVRLSRRHQQRRQLLEQSRTLRTQGQALAREVETLQAKQAHLDGLLRQIQQR